MNKLTIIGLLVLSILFGACKTENYAKKRKAEQKKFENYKTIMQNVRQTIILNIRIR